MAKTMTFIQALDELEAAIDAAQTAHTRLVAARRGYVLDEAAPDGMRSATEQDVADALALRDAADRTTLAKRVQLAKVQLAVERAWEARKAALG